MAVVALQVVLRVVLLVAWLASAIFVFDRWDLRALAYILHAGMLAYVLGEAGFRTMELLSKIIGYPVVFFYWLSDLAENGSGARKAES